MCYFGTLLDKPEASIAVLAHNARHPRWGRVDFVVGIGLSGTMPLIGLKMNGWPVLALRKQVSSHGAITYHPTKGQRYLIVDDFIGSGATVKSVLDSPLLKYCECAGVLCYMADGEPWGYDDFFSRDLPTLGVLEEVVTVDKMLGQGYEL